MQMQDVKEQVKAANNIVDVARELGLEVKRNHAKCIRPDNHKHGDNDPSLSFDLRTNTYKCFRCSDVHGDVIDLVEQVNGWDFNQAKEWLARRAGITLDTPASRISTNGSYLKSRGLTDESIKTYQLKETKGAVKIPYFDHEGKVLFHKVRRTDRKQFYYEPSGTDVQLYNGWQLSKYSQYVVICAGEIDCLSLLQSGYNAVGLPGEGIFKDEWLRLFDHIKTIYICLDGDEAGRQGSFHVAEKLGEKSLIVECPDQKDINDLLCAGYTMPDFGRLLAESKTVDEFIFYFPPIVGAREIKSNPVQGPILTPIADFISQTNEPLRYLVQGLIPLEWLILIAGNTKDGKTLLSLYLAFCVATGAKFLDREVIPGPVCLVLLDDPESLVRKRLRDFNFTEELPVYVSTARFREDTFFAQLEEELQHIKPRLVIIDTLIKTVSRVQGAENDAAVMDGVIERFARIGETCERPNFLLIHHLNRAGTVRGSTATEGAAPVVIITRRKESGIIELQIDTKLEPVPPLVVQFDPIACKFDYLGEKEEFNRNQLEKDIVEFLEEAGEETSTNISKAVSGRTEAVVAILNGSERFDCREDRSGKGRPKKLYFLREIKSEEDF